MKHRFEVRDGEVFAVRASKGKTRLRSVLLTGGVLAATAGFGVSSPVLSELGLAPTVVQAKDKKPVDKVDNTATKADAPKADAADTEAPIKVQVGDAAVVIPAGTKIKLEIKTYLSGNKAKEGQEVLYTVVEPLVVDGQTVIAKDAPAVGKVTFRKGSGGMTNKGSKLSFNAETVTAVDGSQVPLNFQQVLKSKGGLAKTLLFGFGKGKNVKVKPGKKFEVLIGVPPVQEEAKADDKAEAGKNDEKPKSK